jgi:hypothetical protein
VNLLYTKLVELNDQWTKAAMDKQVVDEKSRYFGGVVDSISGIARANHGGSASDFLIWSSSIVNKDSSYYHHADLILAMDRCVDFFLNHQHADGTISLGSTNFNSPPDTGFVIEIMTNIYRLLSQHDWSELQLIVSKVRLFLERTIPAMLTGGVHTPNHRWVITAALALLYEIFPQPELLVRAEEWLAEGMDITEDGEWTERSNGIYNVVSDISLFHVARILNKPELLGNVRLNLRMMIYLVHPSGEVVTEYSGRQDYGQPSTMANYFLIYHLMAAHDRDPLFAAMADYACSFLMASGNPNNQAMLSYLLYPESNIDYLERALLPLQYVKIINASYPMQENLHRMEQMGHQAQIQHSSMHTAFGAPIVRIRDHSTSVTIMSKAPSFFSIRHGQASLLGVKLTSSFGPGIVLLDEFSANQEGYTLSKTMSKGYNGPIPRNLLPELTSQNQISPWYLLPHQDRPMTHLQTHCLQAEVVQGDREWTIHVNSDEREDVFTQLTFIFGAEGRISGEDVHSSGKDKYFLKSGSLLYTAGAESIEISSGAFEHWLPILREDQHPEGCQYVHVNLITPFERTFVVKLR